MIHTTIYCAIALPLLLWPIVAVWNAWRDARTDRMFRIGIKSAMRRGWVK